VIREGLKQAVSWQSLGYAIAGAVSSGEEALRFLEKTAVDVVLADIRMPRVSGIELARLIKLNYPETRVVILSGYNNFSYAQNAIRYGVYHYLLKPCAEEEIVEVFTHLREELEKNQTRKASLHKMQKIMIQEELSNLIAGEIQIQEARGFLSWKQQNEKGVIALLLLQLLPTEQLFKAAINTDIDASSFPRYEAFGFYLDFEDIPVLKLQNQRYLCFVPCEKKEAETKITALFHSLKSQSSTELPIALIGLCCMFDSQENWSEIELHHWLSQVDAMLWKAPLGELQIINHQQALSGKHTISLPDPVQLGREMCIHKKQGPIQEKEQLFETLQEQEVPSALAWLTAYMNVLRTLVLTCGASFDSISQYYDALFPLFEYCLTMRQTKYLAIMLGLLSSQKIESHKSSCYSKSIRDALQRIDQGFQNGINLGELAMELGLTPTYLCKLFKREVGVNFKEYLLEKQMTEAKRLLRTTNAKIYEIAASVGFNDQHYFSEVFKRNTSFTPLEYRKVVLDE
jgi:two-component system response regulator YesN